MHDVMPILESTTALPRDRPLCDAGCCSAKGRSDHLATHEVLLACGHNRFWCTEAVRSCDDQAARAVRLHEPSLAPVCRLCAGSAEITATMAIGPS
jgi:hypothetical protein